MQAALRGLSPAIPALFLTISLAATGPRAARADGGVVQYLPIAPISLRYRLADQRLTGDPAAVPPYRELGAWLSADGDVIVASSTEPGPGDPGSTTYVFERAGGVWQRTQKLIPAFGSTTSWYFRDVAVSGDTIAAGELWADRPAFALGAVDIFERSAGAWIHTAILTAPNALEAKLFGRRVALDGDTLAAAAYDETYSNGRVYVYARSGGAWSHQATLTPTANYAPFWGDAIALDGNVLVVSSNWYFAQVMVYERSGATWVLRQTIDQSACDVDVDGDVILISQCGARVLLYTRSGGVWQQTDEIVPPPGEDDGNWGRTAVLKGGTVVVGVAWVTPQTGAIVGGRSYACTKTGGQWRVVALVADTGALPAKQVGGQVAITNGTVVAASALEDGGLGAIYTFER